MEVLLYYVYVLWSFLMVVCNGKQPNIILILGDDMGWNDVGFHGSNQIPTPNIDALAYNGVILNKFYSQSICTPSRTALLTGNYPIRSGMQGKPLAAGENRTLPWNMPTLPERLKELGYVNHMVGKWHLGYTSRENTPVGRGFDSHFGYYNGFVGYFDYVLKQPVPDTNTTFTGFDLHHNFVPQWEHQGEYATHLFTKKSLEIIDNHDTAKPLFLFLSHLAGHTGKDGDELEVPDVEYTDKTYGYIKDRRRRQYADVTNRLDQSVGDVVKKLAEKKMLENSIVVFLADNGAPTIDEFNNTGSNFPFRGIKYTLFEGGMRCIGAAYSPLFNKKQYVSTQIIHISDFLPTFYAAGGGDVQKLGNIDGINQWSTLVNDTKSNRKEILANIDEVEKFSGLIGENGRYKLLNGTYLNGTTSNFYGDSGRSHQNPPYNIDEILHSVTNQVIQKLSNHKKLTKETILSSRTSADVSGCRCATKNYADLDCKEFCLFDLELDPCETKNIIHEKPEIAEKLKKRLLHFYEEIVPQVKKVVDPCSNPIYFNNTWFPWANKDHPLRCTK